MENAKNVVRTNSFLLVGVAAAGKTTQLITMPGKGFVFFTDPNGPSAIAGYDIDYEMIVRDVDFDEKGNPLNPKALKTLRASLAEKRKADFFKPYDWIALDNITFLFDMVYDDFVAYRGKVNGAGVKEIDTLSQAMPLRKNLTDILADLRAAANLNVGASQPAKTLILIAHQKDKEDSYTGARTSSGLQAWGQLESSIPSYITHIFYATSSIVGDKRLYRLILTDATYERCRTFWRDAPKSVDATIKDWTKPSEFGLGALITKYGGVKA